MRRRTTLILEEEALRELKRIAVEERRTLTDVTDEVIRRGLERHGRRPRGTLARLPTFGMGPARVDLGDRDRLIDLMEGR
jgi:hypothetical protein